MINDLFRSMCYYLYIGKEHKDPKSVNYFVYNPRDSSATLRKHYISTLPAKSGEHIRIVVVGDTHTKHAKIQSMIPECDVFVHCGDIIMKGRTLSKDFQIGQFKVFNDLLTSIKCKYALVMGGNHDLILEQIGKKEASQLLNNAKYLQNDMFVYNNVSFWGTPVSCGSSRNKAFQSAEFVKESLEVLPEATDIIITHGHHEDIQKKIQHRLHFCGHNHNQYGIQLSGHLENGDPVFSICAPICDGHFQLSHLPVVVDFPIDAKNVVKVDRPNETAVPSSDASESKNNSAKPNSSSRRKVIPFVG